MRVFFTGFPGFLGSALLPRVLRRAPGLRATCLVERRFAALARARVADLATADQALARRIDILEGDITDPRLSPDGLDRLVPETVEVYHLAAVYDIAVRRDIASRINVEGTRHVLDFANRCPALRRLHYVSTCYVSGRLPGVFHECDLECGQSFNNWYEETKYLAEREVRARMAQRLPATIYRPSVIVGDSVSGETQKFDGPYFAMQLILRQGPVALMPVVGDIARTTFNTVPRDFVVDAIDRLSSMDRSAGRTYHLADPNPPTIAALLDAIADASRQRVIRVRLPLRLARAALAHVPGVQFLLRLPPETLDYFVHPTTYDTSNAAADLEGSAIAVPPFASYAGRLVGFMRTHLRVGDGPMV